MRLDKFICDCTGLTRSQAGKNIRQGLVTVNGEVVKQAARQVLAADSVTLDDQPLQLIGLRYFMLHKPAGYICANDDPEHPTVFTLLDEPLVERLHSVGRLDLDTTGLLLLTDDGQWSHRLTAPKHHVPKTYRVWTADPIPTEAIAQFAEGIMLRNEKDATKPAELVIVDECEALLTIHEGRYHQVKRMFAALGNKVEQLHREQIGGLKLPIDLVVGEYKELDEKELSLLNS
ncbi:16S rRNA pseudouridine(516) synthase RsuA [Alishewanella sp. SMS8]|uniref:16S rRNA pseudouridine(516) synthase RsuA n=1 Tax=Alishewanella sp. SMS8 TaxID=2994676 RepID=UPI002741C086|nr:16S rRNA pseudouridine(516) synthase RsuA [Alishewanella sp. SMS8]MDP4946182.1 16S rRNA pseudouridine(516) synthase RsuA [Alishewanella sp.]MDP5206454.1 16S rRNA pseudouridine(516) synthase RsuA [Alishewanella sp. SMS9]MDP5459110.1 16S rRNA pseudouridine(516) synthase RsuA [Alishewanella sp. SMS8]